MDDKVTYTITKKITYTCMRGKKCRFSIWKSNSTLTAEDLAEFKIPRTHTCVLPFVTLPGCLSVTVVQHAAAGLSAVTPEGSHCPCCAERCAVQQSDPETVQCSSAEEGKSLCTHCTRFKIIKIIIKIKAGLNKKELGCTSGPVVQHAAHVWCISLKSSLWVDFIGK